MKDPIIDAFPSVLGILLNTTCYRYAKAGVQYIEYSVSSGDLVLPPRDGTVKDADLRWEKFHAMKNEAFSQPYSTGKKVKTPEQEHALELKKRSEAMLRLAKLGLFNINNFPELQVASSLRRNLRAAFSRAEKEREAAMESTAESGPPDEEEEGDDGDYDDASEDDTETSDTEDEDEDDYSVLSTALAGPPVLPTILGEGRMKFRPAWRAHINYFEKPTNQSYHFLAAFNRNSKVVFHKIEQGEWTSITIGDDATAGASASSSAASEKKEAKKFTPREATMWLGDLCSNLPELLAFLKKNEEILKAADGDEDLPDLNISSDKDNFQELCKSGRICDYLKLLAQILCQDKFLSTMYPQLLPVFNSNGSEDVADGAARAFGAATSSTGTRSSIRSNTGATTASTTATTSAGTPSKAPELKVTALQSAEHMRRLHPLLVGLDWVGDEMGHPFCVFSHDAFISLVVKWKKLNPKFGLRFHAGEGPIRPSSRDPPDSTVRLAFYLHMYILVESIRLCHAKLTKAIQDDTEICDKGIKANIRIGHGVAFLFGCNDPADNANVVPLVPYLKEFRTFLKENDIVCELNPTSNHMLLSSTFSSNENPKNERTLRMFLRERVPVVLGTDDDGIWAIHKCRRHHHHVSVAAEFCQAIECGDIQTSEELQSLIQWGRKSAFSARSKSEEKKYSKID